MAISIISPERSTSASRQVSLRFGGPRKAIRVALVRNHDLCLNTRQIAQVQSRAGVLPHLGLGYIHTALTKAGFEVAQIDAPAAGLDSAGLKNALASFNADLVGVTATTPGLPGAVEACRIAKDLGAKVILGGPHTEAFSHENLAHDCIDYVGVGEGITIMPALASALAAGSEPSGIPGLVTRHESNGHASMVDLETAGWPERESLPMHRYYSIMAPRPFATMISSRGCPFRCSFCFKQDIDKSSMFRSAEDVVSEMEYLRYRWGVREIMFYDDVFTLRRKRVFEICDLILKSGLKVRWEAPTRVDLVPKELLQAMAAAGCVRLRFGIEHGDPGILKSMNKVSDLSTIETAVSNAVDAGIKAFGYFIVGYLNESREQFERTIHLACRLPLDYASFYTATPLPGTMLHHQAVAEGLISAEYWQQFVRGQFSKRIGFLVPDAEKRSREAYRRFYFRTAMIGPLTRHMFRTGQFRHTISGLLSLVRSDSNTTRDF